MFIAASNLVVSSALVTVDELHHVHCGVELGGFERLGKQVGLHVIRGTINDCHLKLFVIDTLVEETKAAAVSPRKVA